MSPFSGPGDRVLGGVPYRTHGSSGSGGGSGNGGGGDGDGGDGDAAHHLEFEKHPRTPSEVGVS